ncbi:MAG: TadE/TadG family type IV pilus assembly protein [Actinomycetota bacterium]
MGRRAVLTREVGGVALEMALTVPTLIIVLLAVLEVAVVARLQLELVAAAREGARVAATVPDPSQAVTAVQKAIGPRLADRVRVVVDRPQVVGRAAVVSVVIRHRLVTPLLRWITVDLRGRGVMRVER